MKIVSFVLGPLQTNCYLIGNEESKEAIVIDAGDRPNLLLKELASWNVKAILLTHAHADHIAGLEEIRKQTGAPVYIHSVEQSWLKNPELNGSLRWPTANGAVVCQPAEHDLEDGQELEIAGFNIQVLHTPGHSPGGVSFLIGKDLFSGDALFAQSIGRTDLPGGNYEQLIISIQDKIMVLPDDTVCYPGHGPKTTVGTEKMINPYVTGLLR